MEILGHACFTHPSLVPACTARKSVGVERTMQQATLARAFKYTRCKPATTRTSEQKLTVMAHAPKLLSRRPQRRKHAEKDGAWQAVFWLSLDPNASTCHLSNFKGKRITVTRNTLKYQYFSQLIFSLLNRFCVLCLDFEVGEKLQKAYKRREHATCSVSTSLHAP